MRKAVFLATFAALSLPLVSFTPAPAQAGQSSFDGAPARLVGMVLPNGDARLAVTVPGSGKVVLLNGSGLVLNEFDQIPQPLGLGVGNQKVYIGSVAHGSVQVFAFQARPLGALGAGQREFDRPSSIAVSPVDGRIYVVDAARKEIRAFDPGTLQEVSRIGDNVLVQPADVAVAADGTIFTADLVRGTVDRFNAAGSHLGTFTAFGSRPGQTVRPTSVDFDSQGRVYVVDAFLDQVVVYDAGGNFQTTVGAFGTGPGLMRNPLDVWVNPADGTIFVTDHGDLELETFPAIP